MHINAACLCMVAANVTGPYECCMCLAYDKTSHALLFTAQHRTAAHSVSSVVQTPVGLPKRLELVSYVKHQHCGAGLLQAEYFCRQATGTAYDPELFLEQEPLMGGQPPSPPRAALDVPIPLQRSQTEHESSLTAATRPGTK